VVCFEEARECVQTLLVRPADVHITTVDPKATRDEEKKDSLLRASAYRCLGLVWPRSPSSLPATSFLQSPPHWYTVQERHVQWMIQSLVAGLMAGLAWNVRVCILQSLQLVMTHTYSSLGVESGSNAMQDDDDGNGLLAVKEVEAMVDALLLCAGDLKHASVRQEAVQALIVLLGLPAVQRGLLGRSMHFNPSIHLAFCSTHTYSYTAPHTCLHTGTVIRVRDMVLERSKADTDGGVLRRLTELKLLVDKSSGWGGGSTVEVASGDM
jgi:hypothetical protein